MVKVGIIGAGRIGKVHAETLVTRVPAAVVVAIADPNLPTAQALAQQLNIPHAYADPALIFADPQIEAVVIASSTDTHAPFITQAAAAGKHIFCEKPIDFDLARIDAALAAVKTAGVKLQIGFNKRFDPNLIRIKQAITTGEIGTPHLLHITSRDPSPPPLAYIAVSGGLFFDMTIHDFDTAGFLLGAVEEVYAAAGVLVDEAIGTAGDVDTAVITLRFKNGAIGTIENSRRAVYGYDQRVEVFGSEGAARSENLYPDAVTLSTGQGVYSGLPLHFFMERYAPAYAAELRAFIDYLTDDAAESPVSGVAGRAPVVLAMAALRSHQENRPVRLDEFDQ